MKFSICYQGVPELASCIFKEERRGLVQGGDLVSPTFDHSTLRIWQQEGYPLFLLHQVNSMRGAGSRQPSRSKGIFLSATRGRALVRSIQRAPGSTQDDRKRVCLSRASSVGKVTATEHTLNCYWDRYIDRTTFYSSCFWANHTWKMSSLRVLSLIPYTDVSISPLK